MKLGFLKPEAIAAGIVWFVIIVLASPFFGHEYIRQEDYVTVQKYEELQSEAEYWKEEYETVKEDLRYCQNLLDERGIAY